MTDKEKKSLVAELRHARVYIHFFRYHLRQLSRSEIAVYLALLSYVDNSGLCTVTSKELCKVTDMSDKQLHRAIFGTLESAGENRARPGLVGRKLVKRLNRNGKGYYYQILRPPALERALDARRRGEI